jgi:hypothetical protein
MYNSKEELVPLVGRPDLRERKPRKARLVLALAATLLILLGWKASFPALGRQIWSCFRGDGHNQNEPEKRFDWHTVSFVSARRREEIIMVEPKHLMECPCTKGNRFTTIPMATFNWHMDNHLSGQSDCLVCTASFEVRL